jgi:hypothetical protein
MTSQSGNDYTWLPIWFRLQRVGNVFSGFQSPDGSSWFPVGTSNVAMSNSNLVGLAASGGGGKTKSPSTAAFDHVTLAVKPPPPPAAPTALAAASAGKGEVRLTWKNNATDQTGFKVEATGDDVHFYEIADLAPGATRFVNTGLSAPAGLSYRVRAYNTGGYSGYSNAAGLAGQR